VKIFLSKFNEIFRKDSKIAAGKKKGNSLVNNNNCWSNFVFLLVKNIYNKVMNPFLNLIIYSIAFSLILLCFLNSARAVDIIIDNPLKWKSFEELINAIADFLTAFALAVFPIIIIIAGYQFMSAGGDPNKIEGAKRMMGYALAGLLVILAAKAILAGIKSVMGVQ
jgi:hypothetical protein